MVWAVLGFTLNLEELWRLSDVPSEQQEHPLKPFVHLSFQWEEKLKTKP